MQQANQFRDNENWDEAIAKADEAALLYPDKTEAALLKQACQNAKDIALFKQQEQD